MHVLKKLTKTAPAWCYKVLMPVVNQRSHFRFWAFSHGSSRSAMTLTSLSLTDCSAFVLWGEGVEMPHKVLLATKALTTWVTQKWVKHLDFFQLNWNFQLLFSGCTTRFNQCFISLTIVPGTCCDLLIYVRTITHFWYVG